MGIGGDVARMALQRSATTLAAALIAGASAVGCGGSPSCDAGTGPDVCAIGPAIKAVQQEAGVDVAFYEVSVDDTDTVHLFVRSADDVARPYEYIDGELTHNDDYPFVSGVTFTGAAVDFDPNMVFDQLRSDLGEPLIVDFAITGGPDGSVVYDSQIQSAKGGNLLVRLGKDGAILGVQAD